MYKMQVVLKLISAIVLNVMWIELYAQCNVASLPSEIDESHQLNVLYFGDAINIQKLDLCLEGADISTEVICEHGPEELINAWFLINPIDISSGFLHTSVTTNFGENPYWSYFRESNGVFTQVGSCNDADVSPQVARYSILNGESVYLRISVPTDTPLEANDFLQIKTFINPYNDAAPCYRSADAHGTPLTTFDVVMTERSIGDIDNTLLYVGEEVTVRVNALLTTDDIGFDWVQSTIPHFGNGWDIDYFYDNVSNDAVLQGDIEYIKSGDDCSGVFSDDVAGLCIYINEDGEQILCNMYTHNCPCEESVKENDPLPTGFYGVDGGGGGGCSNDCTPSGGYGIAASENVTLLFNLKVNVDPSKNDLSIGLHMLSDDLSGCWSDDSPCRYMTPQLSNSFTKINPTGAYVYSIVGQDACTNREFEIEILKNAIRSDSITIRFEDNENLNFITGTEFISTNDFFSAEIENTTDMVQEAVFILSGYDEDGIEVVAPANKIKVLPQLKILNFELTLCPEECTTIVLETNYDQITNLQFTWEDGSFGREHLICEGSPSNGQAIDLLGCDTLDFEIEVTSQFVNNFEINLPDVICANESYFVDISGEGSELIQNVDWEVMIAGGSVSFTGSSSMFLDDETLSQAGESLAITAKALDSIGCVQSLTVERPIVNISDQSFEFLKCKNNDIETISLEVPIELNENYDFSDLIILVEQENVNYELANDQVLHIEINEPQRGIYRLDFGANYIEGCQQNIEVDVTISDGYSGEVSTTVSNLTVDFGLTETDGLQNVSWDFGDGMTSLEPMPSHNYLTSGVYEVKLSMTTDCGEVTRVLTVSVGTTAVIEQKDYNLEIYPNPVSDVITVSSGALFNTLILYDINGKTVSKTTFADTNEHSMPLNNISDGLYMIHVIGDNYNEMRTIVSLH